MDDDGCCHPKVPIGVEFSQRARAWCCGTGWPGLVDPLPSA
jgi:hypothetical protein